MAGRSYLDMSGHRAGLGGAGLVTGVAVVVVVASKQYAGSACRLGPTAPPAVLT
jgi:hypothetical protein